MKLEIHPQAAKNFNEKAKALISEIIPDPNLKKQRKTSIPTEIVMPKITVDEVKFADYTTPFDGEVAKIFFDKENTFGLFDESYKNLVRIAENLQKTKSLSPHVSVKSLIDLIFEWTALSYKKETMLPMCEFVLSECEKRVKEMEIWLPVYGLIVETEITLGKTTIKTINKKMIDDWQTPRLKYLEEHIEEPEVKENIERHKAFYENQRKAFQGFAAITMKLNAEPQRAYEIAFDESERVLGILRFFSDAALFPQSVSYWVLLGRENYEKYHRILVEDGKISKHSEAVLNNTVPFYVLDKREIEEAFLGGMKELSDLLAKDNRTDFEDELLNAVIQYSKSCLAKDVSDKLIYILVALESMLLRDSNEPIQKNIGERMAVLFGTNVEERKAIIANVTRTYALRSSFIHHGKKVSLDDTDILFQFMMNAWRSLYEILQITTKNQNITREKFFSNLDDKRLSY